MSFSSRNTRHLLVAAAAGALTVLAYAGATLSVPAYFKATVGSTLAGGAGGVGGKGAAAGGKTTTTGAGSEVSVSIDSYSTQEELKALAAAADSRTLIATLSGYSHGSVTVGGKSFTINGAFCKGNAKGYVISVVTAKPLSGSKTSASGNTGGLILLTVNSSGAGTGSMYTATELTATTSGGYDLGAVAGTATQLTSVVKQ